MSIQNVVKQAVMAAWEAEREVPFPLYDREAEAIAAAAIRAYEGEKARRERQTAPAINIVRIRDEHARREILRIARSDAGKLNSAIAREVLHHLGFEMTHAAVRDLFVDLNRDGLVDLAVAPDFSVIRLTPKGLS